MSRRHFLWLKHSLLLVLFFSLFLSVSSGRAASLPAAENNPGIERLSGLDRHYDLTFLWFDHLAVGQLSFAPEPLSSTRYRARLEARTLGAAAWLTGDRVQRYETLMELTPQGRLLPLEYQSVIHKKKGNEVSEQTKFYTFDPAARSIVMTRIKDGKRGAAQPIKFLGDHFPVDFLTAGFNFISGADGPITIGARKEIITFTDEGERKILIEVLKVEDWPKTPFFVAGSGTLLKFILPKEILDTGGGAVYGFLDNKLLPQRALVENVLGMGDVRAELRP